jgi:hypothetical protein
MGGTGRNSQPPKKDDHGPVPSPLPIKRDPLRDDDVDDGDFATPKRDIDDTDDQPL